MDIKKLLDKRNALYGICAIKIVLFHIFHRIGLPIYIPIVTEFVSVGMGVEVFLFFSGLCLTLSANRNHYAENGWRGYYKKRFFRVLLPYFLIATPYYLWNCFAEHSGSIARKLLIFAANLSSASFWLKGTQTTWFVFAIIVFYLLFPYLYMLILRNKNKYHILALIIFLMCGFAYVTSIVPVLKNSTIVWARLPVFTIGAIAGGGTLKR